MEHLPRRVPAGNVDLLDYLVPILQEFVGDVPILGDLIEILSGVEDGTVDDVGSWVNNLVANLTGLGKNTNRILMELQAKLADGAKFTDTFDRADNTSVLGNGWVQGGAGEALGIIGNAARIDNSNPLFATAGRRYAICPQAADSDNMTVAAGVNNAGVAVGAMTSLFIRANASLTEFVYANVYGKSVYLGRGTRSGTTWTFTDWTSKTTGVTIPEGALLELQANGSNYLLTCNGQTLLSHPDSSGYPVDASHRTVGFASETRQVGLLKQFSWGLVAFTLRSAITLTALDTTKAAADSAVVAAAEATESSVGVANALAEYTSSDEGAGNAGQSFFATFPGPSISSDWSLTTAGALAISNQVLNVAASAAELVFHSMRYNVAGTDTDDMSVKCVVADTGSAFSLGCPTVLYGRLASGGGSFVYCKIYKDRITIGKGGGAYGSFDAPWASTSSVTLKAGYTVDFRMLGNVYSVRVNGVQVLTYTDGGNTASVGSSNRFGGMGFSKDDIPFGYIKGPGVTAWAMNDIQPQQYNGTGWGLYRANTSAVNLTATVGNDYQFAGIFDNTRWSQGVTVADQADGEVIILKSGPYSITVGYETPAFTEDENVKHGALLWKSVGLAGYNVIRRGDQAEDTRQHSETFNVYLDEGDIVRGGFYCSSTARDAVSGDTFGTKTYFDGALQANPVGRKGDKGDKGDDSTVAGPQGIPGPGLDLAGTVATYGALPTLTSGDVGKQYLVSGEDRAYLWLGSAWHATAGNGINLRGPQGNPGTNGTNVTINRVTSLPSSGQVTGQIYWIPV
ncbi:hypothetical protein ACFTWF_32655 [Rhodococcus sp. NPDC056960]|uniref:DUF7257 domain-containing protein n=1 Tax=Rhodococcus sp. NPDC056960 TaxID=3345982 RepID=UPI00362ED33D